MRDYNIESDLKQEKFEVIKLVQGDKGNKLTINVLEDGQPVNLTGCSITAKYKRADGQVINGSVINISNNSFDAVIDSDITKVSGTLKMLFSIEKDDVKVSTFLLLADVREGLLENTGSSGGSTGGGEVTVDLSNYYKKNETYSKAQIDSQFKDIANKTVIENNKLYLVKSDGTKLDEGTTLPSSSTENTKVEYYDTQKLGTLFDRPDNYNYVTWCANALNYDKTINKYICLAWARGGHLVGGDDTIYRIIINADTLEVEDLSPLVMLDTDGTTNITTNLMEGASFIILKDGTYIYGSYLDDTKTYKQYRYTSTDYGKTWIKTPNSENGGTGYKQLELSNGRILSSSTSKGSGIWYSDDKLITTKKATVDGGYGLSYGTYVAEWSFIELEPGYVIAIGRKNQGGAGSEFSGDSDHALITYSTNYGSTWSKIVESTTINNMNASNATGIVHDGIVEVFTTSRWYHGTKYTNNDYSATGKDGAMFHYVATIEDAKNDNFTNLGVVLYANGSNNSAQDFHAPCLTHNTKTNDILIVYMDRIETIPNEENNNYHFVIGSLGKVTPKINDKIKSPVFTYSNKLIDKKLLQQKETIDNSVTTMNNALLEKINTLQYALSKIKGSGVEEPVIPEGTVVWSKESKASNNILLTDESNPFKEFLIDRGGGGVATCSITNDTLGNQVFKYSSGQIYIPATKSNFAFEIKETIEANSSNWSLMKNLSLVYDDITNFKGLFTYRNSVYVGNPKNVLKVIKGNLSEPYIVTRRIVKEGDKILITVYINDTLITKNEDITSIDCGVYGNYIKFPGIYLLTELGRGAYIHYMKYGEWGDALTYYNLTNTLTNCDTSNKTGFVFKDNTYTSTITANSSYQLDTVTVTMGGNDITSTVYSNGKINIPNITGDIVITANAVSA